MNRAKALEVDYQNSKVQQQQIFYYVNLKTLDQLGITMWKPEPGDNFIRILPPPDTEHLFYRRVFVHTNIGPDRAAVLCTKKTHDNENRSMRIKCPICEYADKLLQKNKESQKGRALLAIERYLFFILDVKNSKTEALGVRWYDAPKKVGENIRQISVDKRTGKAYDISDPKEGRDVCFVRKGTGIGTQYEGFQLGEPNEIPVDCYKDLPSFDKILNFVPETNPIIQELLIESNEEIEIVEDKIENGIEIEQKRQHNLFNPLINEESINNTDENIVIEDEDYKTNENDDICIKSRKPKKNDVEEENQKKENTLPTKTQKELIAQKIAAFRARKQQKEEPESQYQ